MIDFKVLESELHARGLCGAANSPGEKPAATEGSLQAEWLAAFEQSALDAVALGAHKLAPREPIMGEWFRQGDLGFIYAPRGQGKTWFAMNLAHAIAEGVRFGRWHPSTPRTVLYVDGEMALDGTKERDQALGDPTARMIYMHHEVLFEATNKVLNLSAPIVQQALSGFCLKRAVEVVFLDNLSCLFSGVKENDADAWEMVLPWLLALRRQRIAVVIIHHAGRNGAMRGTSRREDAAFWSIRLTEVSEPSEVQRGARFISRFDKNRNSTEQEAPALEWNFASQPEGKTRVSFKEVNRKDVFRQWIEDGLTSCTDIANEMNISKGQVAKLAKKGFAEGWLKKNGRDYALVSTPDIR